MHIETTNMSRLDGAVSVLYGDGKVVYMCANQLVVDQLKKRHDTEVGRDHLFALLGREGRLVKVKKRFEKTTYSHHSFAVAPNRIKELTIDKPNQVLVSDCSYLLLFGRKFA